MSGCCRAAGCEAMFTPRAARRDLKRYRRKGLDAIERGLVASVPSTELEGARILEIGGGIGALTAEFLAAGAARGEVVELVSAYEPYARQLAEERGIADRTMFRVADVLDRPGEVSAATVVVLNRVVCCSPDGVTLVGVGARLAERLLLLSFPRDRWFVRAIGHALNVGQRLLGRSFRVFLHPPAALHAAARAEGFHAVATGGDTAWEYVAFERNG